MKDWLRDLEQEIERRVNAAVRRGSLTSNDVLLECRTAPNGERIYFSIRGMLEDGGGSQDPAGWNPGVNDHLLRTPHGWVEPMPPPPCGLTRHMVGWAWCRCDGAEHGGHPSWKCRATHQWTNGTRDCGQQSRSAESSRFSPYYEKCGPSSDIA